MGLLSSSFNIILGIISILIINKLEPVILKTKFINKNEKYKKYIYLLFPIILTSLFYMIF